MKELEAEDCYFHIENQVSGNQMSRSPATEMGLSVLLMLCGIKLINSKVSTVIHFLILYFCHILSISHTRPYRLFKIPPTLSTIYSIMDSSYFMSRLWAMGQLFLNCFIY